MASTTVGNLLLHMSIDGDRKVITAIQNVVKTTEKYDKTTKNSSTSSSMLQKVLGGLGKAFDVLNSIVDKGIQIFSYFWDVLKKGVKTGVDYNKNIDYLKASLKALTGSQEIANRLTGEMVELAAETPFQIQHFAKASKTLLGYGIAQEDVMETMTMLGDVAMGNSYSFDRLAYAYGQISAKGKLQAEEVRQMINNSFSPLAEIADITGIKLENMQDVMKDGKISFDLVKKAMQKATGEGGRFNNSMKILSETFAGQQEKIQEYGDMFWGNLIRPFYDILAEKVMPKVADHMKNSAVRAEELGQKLFGLAKKVYYFLKPY